MSNRWQMIIELKEDNLLIWETNRQKNSIIFDSSKELSSYTRRNLANYELFLREENQFELADKIKSHLGKIIRARSCDDLLIADGNYRVNTFLDNLDDTIDRYKKEYNLNLDPDFQRAHVWDLDKRVKYVEFLLKGGTSNPIYFNCVGWRSMRTLGEFVVVDGKQRLTSILMFLNNEFPVFKEMDEEEEIGYYAKEFDIIPNDVEFIINDLPSRELVLKWYLQMNEGNVAHTQDELDKVRCMLKGE